MASNVMGNLQPRLSPAVKVLVIALVVGHVVQISLSHFADFSITPIFGYSPLSFLSGSFWQILTFLFLHGDVFNLLFNILGIYMLGSELESRWGTKKFFQYFLICGLGAALAHTMVWIVSLVVLPQFAGNLGSIPTIGASGALFGLLFAFALLYGDMYMLVFLIVPMKAKHFAVLMAGIELYVTVFSKSMGDAGGTAHLFHLGGFLTGFIYLKWKGKNLDGRGGGFFRRKKSMDRDEVKRRLSLVVNNEPKKGDKNYPITWN